MQILLYRTESSEGQKQPGTHIAGHERDDESLSSQVTFTLHKEPHCL